MAGPFLLLTVCKNVLNHGGEREAGHAAAALLKCSFEGNEPVLRSANNCSCEGSTWTSNAANMKGASEM